MVFTVEVLGKKINKKILVADTSSPSNISTNQDTYWDNVIFADECKFTIFTSDGHQSVCRKKNTELQPRHLIPTVKYGGGNVMVWVCMAASGG